MMCSLIVMDRSIVLVSAIKTQVIFCCHGQIRVFLLCVCVSVHASVYLTLPTNNEIQQTTQIKRFDQNVLGSYMRCLSEMHDVALLQISNFIL